MHGLWLGLSFDWLQPSSCDLMESMSFHPPQNVKTILGLIKRPKFKCIQHTSLIDYPWNPDALLSLRSYLHFLSYVYTFCMCSILFSMIDLDFRF